MDQFAGSNGNMPTQQPSYTPPHYPALEPGQAQFEAQWYPRINLKIARKTFSRIGWALLAMIIVTEIAVGYFDTVLSFWLPSGIVRSSEWSTLISILGQYGVGLAACVGIILSVPGYTPTPVAQAPVAQVSNAAKYSERDWHKLGFGRFFTIFVMCLPVMYGGNIIGSALAYWLSAGHFSNVIDTLLEDANTPESLVLQIVLTVVLAPIVEEFVFRKLIVDRVQRYGELLAVVVSGLAFGLMHANIYQFFYTFGIGMIWAYVYLRTGKLRYTIALHMSVNTFGGAVPMLIGMLPGPSIESLDKLSTQLESQGATELEASREYVRMLAQPQVLATMCFGFIMIFLLIIGIAMWVRHRRMFVLYPSQWQLVPGVGARTAWINPGMIVYLIFTVSLTLILPVLTVFSA